MTTQITTQKCYSSVKNASFFLVAEKRDKAGNVWVFLKSLFCAILARDNTKASHDYPAKKTLSECCCPVCSVCVPSCLSSYLDTLLDLESYTPAYYKLIPIISI